MSFCPNCGSKIDEGSKFCGECGTRIDIIPDSTEAMPWEQNVTDETEAMPWEQNVTDETEAMPWEQNVTDETEAMSWEQNVTDETEAMPWKEENPEVTLRPSQIKKAREKSQKSGSSITLKKPNINVKDYKDKAKKLSKAQVIVIAECLCLLLVIAVFWGIGSSKSSAKSVAKEYSQAYADQNWSKVYDLTDFPDGTYLQKEQFIECMKNANAIAMDNFEITELSSDSYMSETILFGYQEKQPSSTSGIQKFYNVQYTVKGQGTGYMPLELIKQSEKSMLFFDTWKVASNDMVINNYYISVPTGASVTLDGILLNEVDKLENQGYGIDEYCVSIFRGTHKIQAVLPWFQIYEAEFDAYAGDEFTVSDMSLTEDGELALQAKMQEALEKFYQAAVANKDFSEVSDLFMNESLENAKESYDYFAESLNGSDYYSLNEVTFDDFECEFYVNESGISAEMSYDYDMDYTYVRSSWFSNKKTTETRTDSGYSYMNASFEYDGETYKLVSINVRSVL